MKAAILAFLMAIAAAPAAAEVSYDFTAYDFNGQSLGGFTLTTPDFLVPTANAPITVSAAQFDSCTLVGGCGDAQFSYYQGFLGAPKNVLAFGGPAIAAIYFFADGTFSTPGTYTPANSDIPTPTGRLQVLQGTAQVITPVPEPGVWVMLGLGLAVTGAAARRRRKAG